MTTLAQERILNLLARFSTEGRWSGYGDSFVQEYCVRGIRQSGRTHLMVDKLTNKITNLIAKNEPVIPYLVFCSPADSKLYRAIDSRVYVFDDLPLQADMTGAIPEIVNEFCKHPEQPVCIVIDLNTDWGLSFQAFYDMLKGRAIDAIYTVRKLSSMEVDAILDPPRFVVS